jgi:hypothetical protein
MSTETVEFQSLALMLREVTFEGDLNGAYTVTADRIKSMLHMYNADKKQIERLYNELLKQPWLSPRMRRAIIAELYGSLRAYNRGIEHAKTTTWRYLINERKAELRKKRGRPREGIHEQAIAQIANTQGISAEALKKRLQRSRQRQK